MATEIYDRILELVKLHDESFEPATLADKEERNLYVREMSPYRGNIVSWLFSDQSMEALEINCGCGAVSEAISKLVGRLTCVELPGAKSEICKLRLAGVDNVNLIQGNIASVNNMHFDRIFWIGLNRQDEDVFGKEIPLVDKLKVIDSMLVPGGEFVFTVNNPFGLRYWAGMPDDISGDFFQTIMGNQKKGFLSKAQIEQLLAGLGYSPSEYYYLYPDYEVALSIYYDKKPPQKGDLKLSPINFDGDRVTLFDETKAFDNIIENGLFKYFSNSYLVVAKKGV